MKYFERNIYGFYHEISYQTFRRLSRRKGYNDGVMLNGGIKVGRFVYKS